ncbi:MAG: hypothetical protein A3A51_05100 [Candidatus Levybacteria bacterium RIFCSPLOWO2_01_FULL_39_10]|nr:MAG: hypothetical protein A3A51_05100 [Candidatus Levybacteria bacterium RIFCSPLOWO2_01_FULL_39_10]
MPSPVEAPRMQPEVTNTPLPVDQIPIGDLSRDLNSGRRIKKLGGIGAFVAGTALIGSGTVSAQDSENPETAALLPDETPRFEPFNADVNGDGQVTLCEFIVTFPDRIQRFTTGLTEAVAKAKSDERMAEVMNQRYIGTFRRPTIRLMDRVLNQEEQDIRDVTFEDLKRGLTRFYKNHKADISRIDIAGWEFYSRKDLPGVLNRMRDGTKYSRELASEAEDEVEAKKIIDRSRLLAASEIFTDQLLMYDVTKNPRLKNAIRNSTDLLVDWAKSSLSLTGEEIAESIGGYAEYEARNYRYKGAYPPVEH